MKLSEIAVDRTVTVGFPTGSTLNVTYDTTRLTPQMEADLADATEATQLVELTLAIVKSWDLTEDGTSGDEPVTVPLEKDRLMNLPLVVLATVVRAVAGDIAAEVRAEGKD